MTILIKALLENNYEYLYKLLLEGKITLTADTSAVSSSTIDINAKDQYGCTALIYAVEKGHNAIVERLLEIGAEVNVVNNGGFTALMYAATKGNAPIAEKLLEKGAEVNVMNNRGFTALMYAAGKGHIPIVEKLLETGVEVNITNKKGWTALMFAAAKGNTYIVEKLLEKDAEVNIASITGWTALIYAAGKGYTPIVEKLLKKGAEVNIANQVGFSPLVHAAIYGHNNIIEILLEKGADVNIANQVGFSALMYAAIYGHNNIIEILLEKGAYITATEKAAYITLVNKVSEDNDYVKRATDQIIQSSLTGAKSTIKTLLDIGVDANTMNSEGINILMLACKHLHEEIVEILINAGADLNYISHQKGSINTALMSVLVNSNYHCHLSSSQLKTKKLAIIKKLVEAGANLEIRNEGGLTAIDLAFQINEGECVKYLLSKGAVLHNKYIIKTEELSQTVHLTEFVDSIYAKQSDIKSIRAELLHEGETFILDRLNNLIKNNSIPKGFAAYISSQASLPRTFKYKLLLSIEKQGEEQYKEYQGCIAASKALADNNSNDLDYPEKDFIPGEDNTVIDKKISSGTGAIFYIGDDAETATSGAFFAFARPTMAKTSCLIPEIISTRTGVGVVVSSSATGFKRGREEVKEEKSMLTNSIIKNSNTVACLVDERPVAIVPEAKRARAGAEEEEFFDNSIINQPSTADNLLGDHLKDSLADHG